MGKEGPRKNLTVALPRASDFTAGGHAGFENLASRLQVRGGRILNARSGYSGIDQR
jgi:hypothetical protein